MSAVVLAQATAATHPGVVRARNEDALLSRDELGLWAVADGAGGHGSGEVASGAVIEALSDVPAGLSAAEVLAQVRLRIGAVHGTLQARSAAEGRPRPMATTVALLVLRGGHYAALWAGDSRVYLLRGGRLLRVTRDHSLVQEMVEAGEITAEEAEAHPQANVITRAVGVEGVLDLEKATGRAAAGDRFLLCSDGLFKALPETAVEAMLRDGAPAETLIAAALAAQARDNVTAIVVSLE
ncbi:PP2C family protein-serine/threonine phosphatase [Roseomonas sp. CCTCC AB2023176]|uniref:PP2C family protein-serine/threonine phosphatase n=1 Tax=Roseomonas sp. CCTCC AB2023176 TaxID=3342640 RepID=UPI0035DD76F6